ncbi:MAG: hypothetical protein K2N18_02205, partial [Clostridia bacterium]|nr:hypothetical protein [Clostridia bacterium]
MLRTLDVNKIFISKNRKLEQAYTWVNGFIMVNYREGDKVVSAREGSCYPLLSSVLKQLPTKVDKLVRKAQKLVNAKPIEPGVY